MYYLPILGAAALGAGFMFERIILKKRKIDIKLYQAASFLAIVLVLLPLLFFSWKLEAQAFTGTNLIIFALVIIFSLIANIFTFYSMKWEKISNLEPAKLMEPLFTILLAIIMSFFFTDLFDRNLQVIVPALIAGLALVASHIKKHYFEFNRYFLAAIVGSLFFALELITTRLILDYYSPITFYFLRCLSIFVISVVIFRPNFSKLGKKNSWIVFITGIIWVFYRVIVYYGYLHLGVVFTTLMIMLGPVFVYTFARRFLKEKIDKRSVIASIIIVLCVLYAILA